MYDTPALWWERWVPLPVLAGTGFAGRSGFLSVQPVIISCPPDDFSLTARHSGRADLGGERLVDYHTQLGNVIRGHAAEFGLVAAKGPAHVAPLLARVAEDPKTPALARELFAMHRQELLRLKSALRDVEAKLKA